MECGVGVDPGAKLLQGRRRAFKGDQAQHLPARRTHRGAAHEHARFALATSLMMPSLPDLWTHPFIGETRMTTGLVHRDVSERRSRPVTAMSNVRTSGPLVGLGTVPISGLCLADAADTGIPKSPVHSAGRARPGKPTEAAGGSSGFLPHTELPIATAPASWRATTTSRWSRSRHRSSSTLTRVPPAPGRGKRRTTRNRRRLSQP